MAPPNKTQFPPQSVYTIGITEKEDIKKRLTENIYWAWPHPSDQDAIFPSINLSHKEASISLLSISIRGQTEWKLTFSSPVATAEFPNLLADWVQHFCSIIFWIWKSSTGIPSPSLALFVVMLPKAHWLRIPGCLALGEWSYHHGYLGHEDFFG